MLKWPSVQKLVFSLKKSIREDLYSYNSDIFLNASRRRLSQIGTKWFITDTMADDHNPFAAFALAKAEVSL